MFESFLIIGALTLCMISITILAAYFVEFIHFVRDNKRKEQKIHGLNETVNKILRYEKVNLSPTIIDDDIIEYKSRRDKDYYKSDVYFEELCSRELIHIDDVKMWHKINKKN
tara:strand:- start:10622 stop:10957 length:336 start_codon:yes stop_codon:yes gene_type:complete